MDLLLARRLAAKRRWHPRIVFGLGALFVLLMWLMEPPTHVFFFVLAAVLLISFLNWKFTRFCPACAKTLVQNPPWSKMMYCTKCGARLDGAAA
jgi:hypothetical protein